MSPPSPGCADARRALPELALGIADGRERADALAHLSGCAHCRRELEELSALADELLGLAPEREPPAGFEARVLARLQAAQGHPAAERGRRRRRWRWIGLPTAALAGAAAAAVALTLAFSSDRRLASQYRAALQDAHGQYFASARLRTPDGREAGTVFAYQGSPSWLFYVLRDPARRYREEIVTRSGDRITLPEFGLVKGTWGIATPVPVRDIARVILVVEPRGPTLVATLPVVED